MPTTQEIIEVERIVNLAMSFNWKLVEESAEDGVLRVTIEKRIVPLESETPEG